MLQSHKDLIVWQKSVSLVVHIYEFAKTLPSGEAYRLTDQMCRAATAIPSNIAEGRGRASGKEYRRYLLIAFASAAELETHLIVCEKLAIGNEANRKRAESLLSEVARMLNTMIASLTTNKQRLTPSS